MKMKRSTYAPLLVAFLALTSGGWLLQRGTGGTTNVYFQARLFEEVMRHVSERFVDARDPASLYRMAIDGMLQELGDPHTAFMSADDYEQLRVQTQGEYGGLGIEIDVRDGWVTVISPLPSTPAERAGLRAGDRILEVDGESTKGWTTQDAVSRLRGPKGRPVDLRVWRVGVDDPIPFRVVREEIHINSVPAVYMLGDGVGYVELRLFSESSTEEVRKAIQRLRGEGMRSLVLDLRRNPGGLLDQGIAVSDLFLKRGDLVLDTRGRVSNQNQKFMAMSGDQYADLPVVVLVGPFTASASEIVAGALQDHDRALVLGETTFGKGSVQTLYPLSNNNWLKLTTARWYTPSGRLIQGAYGIEGSREHRAAGAPAPLTEAQEMPRESFRTKGGREVFGGGGIAPDLIVRPDTTTAGEREFARSVERHGSQFNDAVYRFAVDQARQDLQPGFPVTARMLDSFYRALREAGIEASREVYDDARTLITQRLAYEISYAKWGQQEARRRLNAVDPQVLAARELLQVTAEPAGVFPAAAAYAARHPQVTQAADAVQPNP
jgi:carboxyl-terminal processing protease